MVQRGGVGIGNKWPAWSSEISVVAHHGRQAQLIQPTPKRRVIGADIVFFGAQHQVGIVGVIRLAVILIRKIARGSCTRGFQGAVHKYLHQPAAGIAGNGYMPPGAVGDHALAAQGDPALVVRQSKHQAPTAQRNAKITVGRFFENIPVQDHIPGDPAIAIRQRAIGLPAVLTRIRPHPELDGEIAGADICRDFRRVDADLHPVNIIHAVPVKAQRKTARIRLGRPPRPADGEK
jgi:hypothetical protein